ncbi:hypothetical protein [Bradyrhizobium arachidis]|uniref:hypothetical protein n=2 Tax=Bradyrhizobium arachidis TaxID=858423 RepID=UPI003D31C704
MSTRQTPSEFADCRRIVLDRADMPNLTRSPNARYRDRNCLFVYVETNEGTNRLHSISPSLPGPIRTTPKMRSRAGKGHVIWPATVDGVVSLTAAQMGYLLEAIDWRNPQHSWRPQSAG